MRVTSFCLVHQNLRVCFQTLKTGDAVTSLLPKPTRFEFPGPKSSDAYQFVREKVENLFYLDTKKNCKAIGIPKQF